LFWGSELGWVEFDSFFLSLSLYLSYPFPEFLARISINLAIYAQFIIIDLYSALDFFFVYIIALSDCLDLWKYIFYSTVVSRTKYNYFKYCNINVVKQLKKTLIIIVKLYYINVLITFVIELRVWLLIL